MKRLAPAALCLSLLAAPAAAQSADVVFWQSIQNSTNPAEYQAYLNAFPNGQFAELARIRLITPPLQTTVIAPGPGVAFQPGVTTTVVPGVAPGGAPILLAPPGTVVAPGTSVVTTVQSPSVRVSTSQASYAPGQPIIVSYAGMPAYQGEYIVIVPAGSPDTVLSSSSMQHASNRDSGSPSSDRGAVEFAGLPPGAYEARIFSRAMNATGRWEIVGRQSFTVQ